MKKLLFAIYIVVGILTTSCGDETEFNSPALQGNKDGNLWNADFYSADMYLSGFILEGRDNFETIQLITDDTTVGVYTLGPGSSNSVLFQDSQGVIYSTQNDPDPSLSLYPAEGEINIEYVDSNASPITITGTFWFYAYSDDGLMTVNFNEGHFHKVPLTGGILNLETE